MQSVLDVIRVTPTHDYQLALEFENGEYRVFNMQPYLAKRPFGPLKDITIFKLARVENGTVTWPGDLDIAPETLYDKSVKRQDPVSTLQKLTRCVKKPTMTPDVTQVKTQPNFELLVTFADGECKRFSMLPYLQYPAFSPLIEPGKFAFAHVANGTVQWTDDIDISPDTLYLAGQATELNHPPAPVNQAQLASNNAAI